MKTKLMTTVASAALTLSAFALDTTDAQARGGRGGHAGGRPSFHRAAARPSPETEEMR